MYKFKFADIGEGLHEGVVAEIYKKEGDTVAEGDSLFSVETDKVTSDIPAPTDGKVVKVYMSTGDTIHVGDVIYDIDDGSGDSAPVEEAKPIEETKPEVKEEVVEEPAEESAASVVGDIKVSNKVQTMEFTANTGKVIQNNNIVASPLARQMAASKGIDLKTVTGSGTNGRILIKDLGTASVGTGAPVAGAVDVQPMETQKTKLTGMRYAIARAMKRSWKNVAYTNLTLEVEMTKLWDFRQSIVKTVLAETGVKVTLLPFITRATTIALSEFPGMNAKWDDETETLTLHSDVNIGIAVDTEAGLVVPVIKGAQNNSVVDNGRSIIEIATKARSGKLSMADMQGGTFTITNYGSVGALYGVPVINYPEIAILGTGNMIDKVYMDEKGIRNGKVMHLTLAADHRFIDGATIGRFLKRIKELLETPEYLGLY